MSTNKGKKTKGGGQSAPSVNTRKHSEVPNIHTLESGLRVVIEPMPHVRSVSFGIWVHTGSRNENLRHNGIAHFTEHMLFKGTERRTAAQIAETMDAVGGQLNAFTSKEYTCYLTRTLDTHFDTVMDVMTDIFFHSKFGAAELEKERNVILEEIFMSEDAPDNLVIELLHQAMFESSPFGRPTLGTAKTISKLQREDFITYMKKNYHPRNVVISVAGNVTEQEALEKISRAFDRFAPAPAPKKPKPALYAPGISLRNKDIEQVHLALAFPALPWRGDADTFALTALATIFGGGMSSRLFQKLREEHGLVYSAYAQWVGCTDVGYFMIYAALNPANLPDALRLTLEECRRMFTDRVSEAQLSKAREQLKSNQLMSLESSNACMNSNGAWMMLLNKIISTDETVAMIDAISLERFYNMCEQVFRFDKMSLSLVGRGVESMDVEALLERERGNA